jgi:hypothetical protein
VLRESSEWGVWPQESGINVTMIVPVNAIGKHVPPFFFRFCCQLHARSVYMTVYSLSLPTKTKIFRKQGIISKCSSNVDISKSAFHESHVD